jgi:hypothetical protein
MGWRATGFGGVSHTSRARAVREDMREYTGVVREEQKQLGLDI